MFWGGVACLTGGSLPPSAATPCGRLRANPGSCCSGRRVPRTGRLPRPQTARARRSLLAAAGVVPRGHHRNGRRSRAPRHPPSRALRNHHAAPVAGQARRARTRARHSPRPIPRRLNANRHHLRSAVAPPPPTPSSAPPRQLALLMPDGRPVWLARPLRDADTIAHTDRDVPRHRRLSWARLLARVFSTDVTTCRSGGRLKPLGAVLTPEGIALHLRGARAPPRPSPAGQLMLLP